MADLAFDEGPFSGNLGAAGTPFRGKERPGRPVTQHSRDTPQFYLTAPSSCPYLAGKE